MPMGRRVAAFVAEFVIEFEAGARVRVNKSERASRALSASVRARHGRAPTGRCR